MASLVCTPLFASLLELPHIPTSYLVIGAVLAWWFWPQIKTALNPPKAAPAQVVTASLVQAQVAPAVSAEEPKPSVAVEFAALEQLIAARDKLHTEVTNAMARAKALIEKESPKV